MTVTLVVSTTFPQYPGDPRGQFVLEHWRRRIDAGERVEFLAPRTRWCAGELDVDVTRVRYAPASWSTLTGRFGILENVRERPTRALLVPALWIALRRALARRLARGDVDRVVGHMWLPVGWIVADVCGRRGVPYEVYGHGTDVDLALRLPGALRRRLAAHLRGADAVGVPSADKAARVAARLGLRPRVEPMLTGVPSPRPPDLCVGRARAILFVGRLIRQKGVDDLLAAVAQMHPRPELHIAGDGPDRTRLVRLARRHDLQPRFHGFVQGDAKERLFARAGVLCVPSRPTRWGLSEGAPLVISEAFARGLPVVATEVGGIPELCRHGDARLVPAGCPGALSRALGEALDTSAPVGEHDARDSVLKVAAAAV